MLQNESFTKNYNLTTEKIQDLLTDLSDKRLIVNSFMCKQTQTNILIEERKKKIIICIYLQVR